MQAELLEERKHAELGGNLPGDVIPGEDKLRHAAAVDLVLTFKNGAKPE